MIFSSATMNLRISNAVAYLTFKRLEEYRFITHAFSTRLGGVSKGYLKSMNLALESDDSKENVIQNYKIFCAAAGFDFSSIVLPSLVHGNNVEVALKSNRGSGVERDSDFPDTDALITNQHDITIATSHADCTPIFIVDPNKKAVGVVHSGWRGTVGKIAQETVNRLVGEFGCKVEDLVCCLGPCVNRCCFEVGEDTANEFRRVNLQKENKVIFNKNNTIYVDLIQANKQILLDTGVREKNIVLSDICTACNKDLLFSHRIMGTQRGVMLAMVKINF